jgi:dienelactone hydrolase
MACFDKKNSFRRISVIFNLNLHSSIMKNILLFLSILFVFACGTGSKDSASEEAKKPDSDEMAEVTITTKEVSYETDSTEMKGYIAAPSNAEGVPGVLIVHEWWGHNEYTRKRADMLAELGYVAFAIDMYGDGKQAGHPDDAGKFAGAVFANMPEAKARFEAAMDILKNQDGIDKEKIAAIGYCFGGSVVLTMANAGYDLDAVAAFHSGVQLPISPGADLKAKVLVANGAADPFVSPESVESFKAAMDAAGADYQYIAYDSAVHAFTNPGADELGEKFGLPLKYQKAADEASWAEMKKLFEEVFK